MILLDTVTVSETTKRAPHANVIAWLERQNPDALYLSVITIGELERGIAMLARRDARRAEHLHRWLGELSAGYVDRILPFEVETSRIWGRLCARLGRNDLDLQIAATAQRNGFSVATRHVRHFADTGIAVVNPWDRKS